MTVQYRPGGWCDVSPAADGFWLTWSEGSLVSCQHFRFDGEAGPDQFQTQAPEPLMFCRAASGDQDRVLSIHQGHDSGTAWLVGQGRVTGLGPTFGVQPVAIDSTYAYVVRSNQSYDRIRLDTGAVESLPHGVPGSSQGIRDVVGGLMLWADNSHVTNWQGMELHEFSMRGDAIVGQSDPPQIAGALMTGALKFTAIPGEAYEPHVAVNGLSYAVCARTPQGAAFAVFPPFPALLPVPGEPPPIQPPPVQPDPEPIPVSTLPANVKSIRDRFVAKFPIPQGSGPEDFDPQTGGASAAFENKARMWVYRLAQQIRYETNNPAWGVKNAGGGRPQSKDSLANNGPRLINYDLMTAVSSGHPTLVPDPQGEDITGQTFMPVEPVNHLEAPVPQPDPTPVPEPTPTPTPTPVPVPFIDQAVVDMIRDILASNQAQEKQMAGLRSDVAKASKAIAAALLVMKPASKKKA
jgi:hypothetical protein